MAEGAPLLREYAGKTCIVGSNPTVSASEPGNTGINGPFHFSSPVSSPARFRRFSRLCQRHLQALAPSGLSRAGGAAHRTPFRLVDAPEAGGTGREAAAQEFAHVTRGPPLPPVLCRSLDRLGQPRRGIREDSRAQGSTGEPADHDAADSDRSGVRGGRGSVALAPVRRTAGRVAARLQRSRRGPEARLLASQPGGLDSPRF